jgi:hypothetical protein
MWLESQAPQIGINFNDKSQPFTDMIMDGKKTIETRNSRSLDSVVGKRVGIVRTGVGPAMLVGYADVGSPIFYGDAKESDQMVVEYQVKSSPDPKAKGRNDLVRRENPLLEERMDRGGTEDSLFEGAKKIEFQYWNSERKQWEDEWDTRRLERKAILPRA